MKTNAIVAGVGMTHVRQAPGHGPEGARRRGGAGRAWRTPGSRRGDLEAAYVGNAAAGLVTGQESIRGQVILRGIGHRRAPGRQRRERLRQRLDGAAPGLRDGDRRPLRRRARARRREALPRGQAARASPPSPARSTSRASPTIMDVAAAAAPAQRRHGGVRRAPARSARCSWTSTPRPRAPTCSATAPRSSTSPRSRPRTPSTAA